MSVAIYIDVHVPQSITTQLRERGVDILTAIEDARRQSPDDQLLERARALGRVVFTQDVGFKAMAEDWQREGRPFAGLVFGRQLGGTIGQFVTDLELIALACDPDECWNTVQYIPL